MKLVNISEFSEMFKDNDCNSLSLSLLSLIFIFLSILYQSYIWTAISIFSIGITYLNRGWFIAKKEKQSKKEIEDGIRIIIEWMKNQGHESGQTYILISMDNFPNIKKEALEICFDKLRNQGIIFNHEILGTVFNRVPFLTFENKKDKDEK